MEREQKIWKGISSQWVNLGLYLMCATLNVIIISVIIIFKNSETILLAKLDYAVILAGLGISTILTLWQYYDTRVNIFDISSQRILEHKGIFSRITLELELYRVKDIIHEQPFLLRLLGLSNIVIYSSDLSTPQLKIKGIKDGVILKEKIRQAVEQRRDEKGIREIDVN